MKYTTTLSVLAAVLLLTPSSSSLAAEIRHTTPMTPAHIAACRRQCVTQFAPLVCSFSPSSHSTTSLSGHISFTQVYSRRRPLRSQCAVRISGALFNVTPGPHGLHIHTYGDVRVHDATSAGGHFRHWNETAAENTVHAFPFRANRHWGDLGNIHADNNGTARYNRVDKIIQLKHIVGRAMILHAGRDKGILYQPSGDSGPRVAMCVIGIANPDYVPE